MAVTIINLTELIEYVEKCGFDPEDIAVEFHDSHYPAFISHGTGSVKQSINFHMFGLESRYYYDDKPEETIDRYFQHGKKVDELREKLFARLKREEDERANNQSTDQ